MQLISFSLFTFFLFLHFTTFVKKIFSIRDINIFSLIIIPCSLKCDKNGYLINGIDSYIPFYHLTLPTIYDIIYDDGQLIAILSLFANWHNRNVSSQLKFLNIDWYCKLKGSDTIIKNQYNITDSVKRIKVLKFPVSSEIVRKSNGYVDIFNLEYNLTFSRLPFCSLPPSPTKDKKPFAALYTELVYSPRYRIIDWISYHISQGFNHIFIYVNDNSIERMRNDLNNAINLGFVTLVNWNWPKFYNFQDQVPGQMSFLYRNKRRFEWIGMNDIDEIFLPYNGTTIDVLKKYNSIKNSVGSFAAPNRYVSPQIFSSHYLCSVHLNAFPYYQKSIFNPDNVEYLSVHMITKGKMELRSKGTELVNAHFRSFKWIKKKFKENDLQNCSIINANDIKIRKMIN